MLYFVKLLFSTMLKDFLNTRKKNEKKPPQHNGTKSMHGGTLY